MQAVAHQSVGLGLVSRHVSFRRTGGRALWPCSGRARERPEQVRSALCGPGRARARQAPERGRPRPAAGRARAGAAGMATRDQVGLLARRYPAATADVSGRHSRAADCNKRGINLSS